jgi:hypothetical protein
LGDLLNHERKLPQIFTRDQPFENRCAHDRQRGRLVEHKLCQAAGEFDPRFAPNDTFRNVFLITDNHVFQCGKKHFQLIPFPNQNHHFDQSQKTSVRHEEIVCQRVQVLLVVPGKVKLTAYDADEAENISSCECDVLGLQCRLIRTWPYSNAP